MIMPQIESSLAIILWSQQKLQDEKSTTCGKYGYGYSIFVIKTNWEETTSPPMTW